MVVLLTGRPRAPPEAHQHPDANDAELPVKVEGLGAYGFLTKPIEVASARVRRTERQ